MTPKLFQPRKKTHSPRFFLGLFLLIVVSGCQGYREEGSRTFGEFTDDVGIKTAVKTALIKHPEVKGLRIDVDVRRGVVSLYGRIPSAYARAKVIEVASAERGVRQVLDKLTLVEE